MRTLCEASENIYNYLNKTQNNLFMANFFGNLNKKLENKIYSSASTAWIDCLKNIRNKTYLDQEDIIILESFAESISSFDRELQIKSLDIIISRFEKKILSLENKYNTNKKLFYNIGFLTGLLIIIVLI
jgi:stage III sporulation protein AB